MAQFTVIALAGATILIGVAALIVLGQVLVAVSRRKPDKYRRTRQEPKWPSKSPLT